MKKIHVILIFSLLLGTFNCFGQTNDTGDFKILTPHDTSRIEAGTSLTIKWQNYSYSSKDISVLRIDLCKHNQPVYNFTENALNNGEYTGILPSDFAAGKYKIRITSTDETAIAYSEEFTVIAEIPIEIITPGAKDTWRTNNSYAIEWQAPHPESRVYINLFKVEENGQLTSRAKIADEIENNGRYTWTIPDTLEEGSYAIGIRIPPIGEVKYSEPFVIEKITVNTKQKS